MKNCPKCGTSMPDNVMQCPRCGNAMPYTQNYPSQGGYNPQSYNPQGYNPGGGNGYGAQGSYPQGGYNPQGGNNPRYDFKDKTVAAILAILLGWLGLQYFYCGKAVGGILAIVLCIVTCGVMEVVFIIQGILILLMSQEQFEQKYVYTNSSFPLF